MWFILAPYHRVPLSEPRHHYFRKRFFPLKRRISIYLWLKIHVRSSKQSVEKLQSECCRQAGVWRDVELLRLVFSSDLFAEGKNIDLPVYIKTILSPCEASGICFCSLLILFKVSWSHRILGKTNSAPSSSSSSAASSSSQVTRNLTKSVQVVSIRRSRTSLLAVVRNVGAGCSAVPALTAWQEAGFTGTNTNCSFYPENHSFSSSHRAVSWI